MKSFVNQWSSLGQNPIKNCALFQHISLSVPIFTALFGCGSVDLSASNLGKKSQLHWAHRQPMQLVGGIYGVLELQKYGLLFKETNVPVCVQAGNAELDEESLLLETQLAFAAWLSAMGVTDESTWGRLRFYLSSTCQGEQSQSGALVTIGGLPDEGLSSDFARTALTCTRKGQQMSCGQKSASTLGWGRTGSIQATFPIGTPDHWIKASLVTPAHAVMSPYVHWISLGEDISRNEALGEKAKRSLLEGYESLLTKEVLTFSELTQFHGQLAAAGAKSTTDPEITAILRQFGRSGKMADTVAYTPRLGLFHPLLHEVGHQFGMGHAHAPAPQDVNGTTGSAVKKAGAWCENAAVMAYGEKYLYLTRDDLAGAKSLADSVAAFVRKRAPQASEAP